MTEHSPGGQPASSGTGPEQSGTGPEPPGSGLPDYLDLPLRDFLGQLALAQAAPAGGSAAALAVALAASLCEMAARLSGSQLGDEQAADLANQAGQAAVSCGRLITADAAAYAQVIRAMRDKVPAGSGTGGGSPAVTAALSAASDAPLQVVEIAAEIGGIAERLAISGNPSLRGDAATAALLAQAGARAAANLVKINLTGRGGPAGRAGLATRIGQAAPGPPAGDDGRLARAARLLAGLARAVARLRLPG